MPKYTQAVGIELFKDDICRTCNAIDICNVYSDLRLDRMDSKWNDQHIVHPGQGKGREDYLECKSYEEYVSPNDKPYKDPDFGLRISQQEAELRST